MPNITLKDKNNANVIYVEVSHVGNTRTYIHKGASLMDSAKLSLSVKENGKTNRIVGKLSVPTVGTNPSSAVPSVLWTEVGSFDLSSVLIASAPAAEDFIAQFSSLTGSETVKSLYTNGV